MGPCFVYCLCSRVGSVAVAVPAPTILCFAPLSIVTARLVSGGCQLNHPLYHSHHDFQPVCSVPIPLLPSSVVLTLRCNVFSTFLHSQCMSSLFLLLPSLCGHVCVFNNARCWSGRRSNSCIQRCCPNRSEHLHITKAEEAAPQ